MKKQRIKIDILAKKVNFDDIESVKSAYNKYFNLPVDDPNRPDKETALWFLLATSQRCFPVSTYVFKTLENGYLNFEDLMRSDFREKLVSTSGYIYALFTNLEHPLPLDTTLLKELFSLLDGNKQITLARGLLSLQIEMAEVRPTDLHKKEKYIEFLNASFQYLFEVANMSEDFLWRNCTYIPSKHLINKFKNTVGFRSAFTGVANSFEIHASRNHLPYEQIIDDLAPYFATLPQSDSNYPYTPGVGTEILIDALARGYMDIGREGSNKRRRKIYNVFIKPLIKNPTLLDKLPPRRNYYNNYNDRISDIVRIGAAVVPAEDTISFIDAIISLTDGSSFNMRRIVEIYANVKTHCELPVSEEFIHLQHEINMYEGNICYNNSCINKLSFWLSDMMVRRKETSPIFPESLLYNSSFLRTFKAKVEEVPTYMQYKESIAWNIISRTHSLPHGFIAMFADKLKLGLLHSSVLASLDEKLVSLLLSQSSKTAPPTLMEVNKNLSAAFVALNAPRLCRNRYAMDNSAYALSELVAAL